MIFSSLFDSPLSSRVKFVAEFIAQADDGKAERRIRCDDDLS